MGDVEAFRRIRAGSLAPQRAAFCFWQPHLVCLKIKPLKSVTGIADMQTLHGVEHDG